MRVSTLDADTRRDDTRPVAKVSAQPRQMSLKEENQEIAKLRREISTLEQEKITLHEQCSSFKVC